jgi:hypothetical protein
MTTAAPSLRRLTPQAAILLLAAAVAWLFTVGRAGSMAGMTGTMGLSGLVCKFVRCGHAARASCSSSSKRCSSRSRSDRVKCQSNGTAVCS